MVLEARFVSSCLIFPSSAMPLLSLLLASRGTSTSVLVKVLFGPTFSLEEKKKKHREVMSAVATINTSRSYLP